MLIYNPSFDLYHTVFRILDLINFIQAEKLEIEKTRILDFIYTFPSYIPNIEFTRELLKYKKLFKSNNVYEEIKNPKEIFKKMEPFQLSSIKYLVSIGYLNKELFEEGYVKMTNKEIASNLKSLILESQKNDKDLLNFIKEFSEIKLYGPKGIKSRTKLIQYKYDAV